MWGARVAPQEARGPGQEEQDASFSAGLAGWEGKGPGSVSPSLLCTQVLPRPDLSPRRAQETRLRGQCCETL